MRIQRPNKGSGRMNVKIFFKRLISHGAVLYTVFSVFLLLLSLMLSDESASKFLKAEDFLYIALFSYILSLGSTMFASGYFSAPLSRLVHAVCYNIGFFIFLVLRDMQFTYVVILTAIFAVIYTIAAIITNVVIGKTNRSKTNTEKPSCVERSGKKSEKEKPQSSKSSTYKSRFS